MATPHSAAQDPIELQTLLRKAPEDGSSGSTTRGGVDDDDSSSDASDDAEYHTGPLSRVTSQSKSYTVNEEKTVIRKFDRRLVLFMALLYLLSFLDRSSQTLHISP